MTQFERLAEATTPDGKPIVLSREGLLQVDRLLHDYFLDHHRGARYA